MTQCFKDYESDTQVLNHNTVPISECEVRLLNLWYNRRFRTSAGKGVQ
jgi:hypothetical protein